MVSGSGGNRSFCINISTRQPPDLESFVMELGLVKSFSTYFISWTFRCGKFHDGCAILTNRSLLIFMQVRTAV